MAKRGRKSWEPTDAQRRQVLAWVEEKRPVARMAKALKITEPTLRKYFPKELISEKKSADAAAFPYKIEKRHRDQVVFYIGTAMSVAEVADAMDCTAVQLEKEFEREIRIGKAKAKAFLRDTLKDEIDDGGKGKITAAKRLLEMTEVPDNAQVTSPGYVSKKKTADANAAAAAKAGSKFAPPTGPRMVVDNTKTA
jgi:hypothetical protein